MQLEDSNTKPLINETIAQLIVFRVSDEEFGVPIDAVREIIKSVVITPIPNSPEFIKGIINVRGEIVTTIELRSRFSLPVDHLGEAKHIIVTKQNDGLFGLIVDEVIEVLRIIQNDIKSAPPTITTIHQKYVKGIITHENRLIILLDLNLILSHEELQQIKKQIGKVSKRDSKQ